MGNELLDQLATVNTRDDPHRTDARATDLDVAPRTGSERQVCVRIQSLSQPR